ncbi:unnamed protein product [Spirodela intermedia]|uniref:Uncharacterized protein n=1 Tax=Spirodela intermedia TaxID=51605 RepID=A0A7I8JQY3_SPIIN|nr:unnamed protein product [Spirodela intermedia]CAA6672568.1 unnamed protein product [Spirodela intermedia]
MPFVGKRGRSDCHGNSSQVMTKQTGTEAEIHVRNRLILRSIQTAKNFFRGSFSGRRGMLDFEPPPSFDSASETFWDRH